MPIPVGAVATFAGCSAFAAVSVHARRRRDGQLAGRPRDRRRRRSSARSSRCRCSRSCRRIAAPGSLLGRPARPAPPPPRAARRRPDRPARPGGLRCISTRRRPAVADAAARDARGDPRRDRAASLFAIVFFRLWYLQVLSGDKYLARGQRQPRARGQGPGAARRDRRPQRAGARRQPLALAVQVSPTRCRADEAERTRASTGGSAKRARHARRAAIERARREAAARAAVRHGDRQDDVDQDAVALPARAPVRVPRASSRRARLPAPVPARRDRRAPLRHGRRDQPRSSSTAAATRRRDRATSSASRASSTPVRPLPARPQRRDARPGRRARPRPGRARRERRRSRAASCGCRSTSTSRRRARQRSRRTAAGGFVAMDIAQRRGARARQRRRVRPELLLEAVHAEGARRAELATRPASRCSTARSRAATRPAPRSS